MRIEYFDNNIFKYNLVHSKRKLSLLIDVYLKSIIIFIFNSTPFILGGILNKFLTKIFYWFINKCTRKKLQLTACQSIKPRNLNNNQFRLKPAPFTLKYFLWNKYIQNDRKEMRNCDCVMEEKRQNISFCCLITQVVVCPSVVSIC